MHSLVIVNVFQLQAAGAVPDDAYATEGMRRGLEAFGKVWLKTTM